MRHIALDCIWNWTPNHGSLVACCLHKYFVNAQHKLVSYRLGPLPTAIHVFEGYNFTNSCLMDDCMFIACKMARNESKRIATMTLFVHEAFL